MITGEEEIREELRMAWSGLFKGREVCEADRALAKAFARRYKNEAKIKVKKEDKVATTKWRRFCAKVVALRLVPTD